MAKIKTTTYFTEEEKDRLIEAFTMTWEGIAPDALEGYEEGLPREEVIEITTDAGRPEMYGNLSRELLIKYYQAPKAAQEEIDLKAFPYDLYF